MLQHTMKADTTSENGTPPHFHEEVEKLQTKWDKEFAEAVNTMNNKMKTTKEKNYRATPYSRRRPTNRRN